MKRFASALAMTILAAGIISCNDSSEETTTTTDSSTITSPGSDATGSANTTPMAPEDSEFFADATIDGMIEVEMGSVAQQNATNERIKAFAQMMVTDHSQANTELQSLVAGRATIPDGIPSDKKKHIEEMQKIKGKGFDQHYVQMMVDDHKKAVTKFENASKNVKDPQLKQWADKTLPILKKHLDSIQAISKIKL